MKTMKDSTMRWMIAAAALAVVAGTASAQTYKADIELTFRAGHTLMNPGSYQVSLLPGASSILVFKNLDTSQSVILLPTPGNDAPKEWRANGKPIITFQCADEGRCVLTGMWDGAAQYQYKFPTPAARGEHLAEVIVPLKAD
jgi:hypothetical protein